jgi:protein-disulfide isomerase
VQARNTLLEYGDFECSYCGQAYWIVNKLLAHTGDSLRFVFRNFPLTEVHPDAFLAACAAESAGRQGRFWDMHDVLYENQPRLSEGDLMYYAQRLRLNMSQFMRDVQSQAVANKIREDFMSGVRSGVNGTPTFFINERRYDGSFDYASLMSAIQRAGREVTYG